MPPKFVRNPGSSDYVSARSAETRALLNDDSDEDFFLTGPNADPKRLRSDPKIDRLQHQVNEVVDVMQNNVSKVLERGDRLEDLQDKSDSLAGNSDLFRSRAKGLSKKMWWKNCKMRIVIVIVILIILAVILIPIIINQTSKS